MVSQINVKCDFGKGVSEDIYARYGESGRVVSFDFVNSNMEEGVVEVSNARFCLVKSDGNFVIQDFDNSVGLDLTSNMCASSGIGSYEVQVNIDGVVVSGRGSFIVSDRIWNDEVIESVSEGNGLVFPDDFQEKLVAGEGIKIEGNVISWDGTVDWTRWYKSMKEWRDASIVDGIAEFETVEEGLLKELKVEIEPVQDLHGYDKPWVGGAGKNLLPLTVEGIKSVNTEASWDGNTYILNGITFTILVDNDGNVLRIHVEGTATDGPGWLSLYKESLDIGGCILSGCPNDGSVNTYVLSAFKSNPNIWISDYGMGVEAPQGFISEQIYIEIKTNYSIPSGGIDFYPMIRLATETDATFEPYTNICPISGWNSVDVSLNDGDGVSQREYSIALGQTVYSGVLDVTNGELRIEKTSYNITSFVSKTNSSINNGFQTTSLRELIEKPSTNRDIIDLISNSFYNNVSYDTAYKNGQYICANVNSTGDVTLWFGSSSIDNLNDANLWIANNPVQIVYPLATPLTIKLTSQEILALEGVNNISTDSGDVVSCVYSNIARMISARNVYMDNGETVQKAVSDLQ